MCPSPAKPVPASPASPGPRTPHAETADVETGTSHHAGDRRPAPQSRSPQSRSAGPRTTPGTRKPTTPGAQKPAPRRPKRGSRRKAWVPDQHGAWAMLALPPLLGVFTSGANWRHTPLLLAWWSGYFTYQAWAKWVKVRGPRKAEYRAPLAVYGAVTGVGAVASIASAPALLWWGLVLAPLIAVAVIEVLRRNERSLLSGVSTVLAAGLTLPIATSLGTAALSASAPVGTPGLAMSQAGWAGTTLVTAYFLGTVLHVKALIRERASLVYWWATTAWHAAFAVACVVAAVASPAWLDDVPSWALWLQAALWLGLTVRTWAMVRAQHAGRRFTPKQIGIPEIAISVAVGGSVVPLLLG